MTLQADRLACARGGRPLFAALDFALGCGDALRVSGANGSGKTSLLRTLCGLAAPAEGRVRWNGRDIGAARAEYCRELAYIGHAGAVKDDLSALENLRADGALAGRPVGARQAARALEDAGLGRVAALPARVLSQGQRKRVALARLQLAAAPLWILDEPFSALDQDACAALVATLDGHLARGGMLVYTTHQDIALAARRHLTLALERAAPC